MNKKRKLKVVNIVNQLNSSLNIVEQVKDEEDEARENIPENLENSELYEESESWSDLLEDTSSSLQNIIDNLQDKL